MKKIVILCAAVVAAAVVQAASVNWTITNVYSGEGKLAKGTGTAYLFLSENTTNVAGLKTTSLSDVQGLLKGGKMAEVAALSVAHAANTADGTFGGATGLKDFSSGSLTAFAVIFDGASAESASNYFVVSGGATQKAEFTSATGTKNLGWGDQTSFTQGADKWSPAGPGGVPEPTSGVLLILGAAGLALRRKQK